MRQLTFYDAVTISFFHHLAFVPKKYVNLQIEIFLFLLNQHQTIIVVE